VLLGVLIILQSSKSCEYGAQMMLYAEAGNVAYQGIEVC
jgi:hypothetical protein